MLKRVQHDIFVLFGICAIGSSVTVSSCKWDVYKITNNTTFQPIINRLNTFYSYINLYIFKVINNFKLTNNILFVTFLNKGVTLTVEKLYS
jgi:hypothetical protein